MYDTRRPWRNIPAQHFREYTVRKKQFDKNITKKILFDQVIKHKEGFALNSIGAGEPCGAS